MRRQSIPALVIAAAVATLVFAASGLMRASTPPGIALTGQVSSDKDGPMEGVLVSARKDGSTLTMTVVSDEKGHYSFPSSKVGPGHYSLRIRAAGYDLNGPKAVDVASGTPTSADIKLRPTQDLASQLSDAEWVLSIPGTNTQKRFLLDCNSCHTVGRIMTSTHDADEFVPVFQRMAGYYPGSTPLHPQKLVGRERDITRGGNLKAAAEWLASVNLSSGATRKYALKTLPRPRGRATHVIMTEYDLTRKLAEPHDVIVDSTGTAWYSDFGEQFIGKLDPRTGKVTEYPIPLVKKGFPTGTLDLQFDSDENLWVAMMYQGAIAKFDRKTEKFQVFPLPDEWQGNQTQESMVSPTYSRVDGKVWTNNQDDHSILRLDLATGKYENLGTFEIPGANRTIRAYGIPADQGNNIYLLDFSSQYIGHIDAKTRQFTVYPTPTPNSRPRRGRVDAQGRLWFAEYGANGIGMFDPQTGKIQEWVVPTPWSAPYQVVPDKNGELWAGSMWTDQVTRFDPKTGRFTEYLLPRETNIRRVFVDNSTTPVTFWVGSNHGASIIKLEPLD